MGNPVTSGEFIRLLTANLLEVAENTYKGLPDMIPVFFDVLPSSSAWEEFFEVGGVHDIPEFMGTMTTLGSTPGYYKRIEHKSYGAKRQWTRNFIKDKKYSVMEADASSLMVAAHRTREKHGVRPFAYAFSASFDHMESEEGVALCSSSHTTKDDSVSTATGFSNAGSSAMDQTTVAATAIAMSQFRDSIGERISIGTDLTLVVPRALKDTADIIVGTDKKVGSAYNDINPSYKGYGVLTNPRLDDYDTNNWFMVDMTMMKKFLKWFDREKAETAANVDFNTLLTEFSVYMRYSYGWTDWRWIYGHNV